MYVGRGREEGGVYGDIEEWVCRSVVGEGVLELNFEWSFLYVGWVG